METSENWSFGGTQPEVKNFAEKSGFVEMKRCSFLLLGFELSHQYSRPLLRTVWLQTQQSFDILDDSVSRLQSIQNLIGLSLELSERKNSTVVWKLLRKKRNKLQQNVPLYAMKYSYLGQCRRT